MFDNGKRFICFNNGVGAVMLSVALFLFTLQTGAMAVDDVGRLMDKARVDGSVKVIVTMKTPAMPDRAAMAVQEFDRLLATAVSAVQDRVLGTLPPESLVSPPRRFTYTPQFAVTVTADGLNSLINNPDVITVQEDIPVPPTLDQSVPHIFPSHDTSSYTGSGWAVAILDTGVDKGHSFLSGKVVSEACYSTDYAPYNSTSVCPGGASSSTATDSGLPCDQTIEGCDHGTHVGGIAAGNGTSFDGVAREADLIAIQVFSRFTDPTCADVGASSPCALSYTSDQISALNRVYALSSTYNYNISSVNMSLGGGNYTAACDTDSRKPIIDSLKSVGIATVIASGNDGYTDAVGAPGCISTAITVGATNDTVDERVWFSNNGPQLDFYAPGYGINSSVPGGGYASWAGTSMATPHVAGAWAVLKQRFPAYTVDQIESAFDATGVTVTYNSISRQRIDVTGALDEPGPGPVGFRYNSIEPCRIVNTRNIGGMLAAGETRSYYVWGDDGIIQSQGGTGNCGIPSSARAVVVNVTSDQPVSGGHFRVFPYNSLLPTASLVNYVSGMTIANATPVPVCTPLCDYDLNVYSSVQSHVLIDVMGYME